MYQTLYAFLFALCIEHKPVFGDDDSVNESAEEDCYYIEYGGFALALEVCFCSYDNDTYTCEYWQCQGEDDDTIRIFEWEDDECFPRNGEATVNRSVSISKFGNNAAIYCEDTASIDCAVGIQYVDTNHSSEGNSNCNDEVVAYAEVAYITDYCYVSDDYSFIQNCDGTLTIYEDETDCTGDTRDVDSIGLCKLVLDDQGNTRDDDDLYYYEYSKVNCACGDCETRKDGGNNVQIQYCLLIFIVILNVLFK